MPWEGELKRGSRRADWSVGRADARLGEPEEAFALLYTCVRLLFSCGRVANTACAVLGAEVSPAKERDTGGVRTCVCVCVCVCVYND